jgi:hypothetical protein
MATAASKLVNQPCQIIGGFKMSVADSVDALWYMPTTNGTDLIVAAGNVFCGALQKKAKVGDGVSLIVTGVVQAVGSGAITPVGGAITVDSGGKIKMASVGTDQVHGYLIGPVSTTDGDVVSVMKIA